MNVTVSAAALQLQETLLGKPAPTLEERETFIAWIDDFRDKMKYIMAIIAPDNLWDNSDVILFNVCGNNYDSTFPVGLYAIDIPIGCDDKYRDPVALAVIHFGTPPKGVRQIPEMMSMAFNKPTAHDRMAAKMFARKLINDNKNNSEVLEWAEKLQ